MKPASGMIKVERLTKTFGQFVAVSDVSFEIKQAPSGFCSAANDVLIFHTFQFMGKHLGGLARSALQRVLGRERDPSPDLGVLRRAPGPAFERTSPPCPRPQGFR